MYPGAVAMYRGRRGTRPFPGWDTRKPEVGTMRGTVAVALVMLVSAALAAAQSSEATGESDCPCKTQDLSYLAYQQPAELVQLIETGSQPYLLLDVRGVAEYRKGHIATAVSLPLAQLVNDGLSAPKDFLVIVYCASGIRSGMAAKYLREQGYTRVVDFGSIDRWQGVRETGDPRPPVVPATP
jgi:phage shock protein E